MKAKIIYEEADDTLNDSECSSERRKEIKKASERTDAFWRSASSWAKVTDISLVAGEYRGRSSLVQGV
jgi:hypothetical protein